MKKLIAIFLISTVFLNGSVLDDKIKNLLGEKEYKIHKNLIKMLFRNEALYKVNDRLKYYEIFKKLKENGLLHLKFDKPKEITLEFKSLNEPLKSYKILKDILHVLGYRYYFTESFKLDDSSLSWKIRLKVEYMIDSVVLLQEIKSKNSRILDVENKGNDNWYYEVDFKNAILAEAQSVDKYEKVRFKKPLKDYFIMVEGASSLKVQSRTLNFWFPYITFFDKNLNILEVIEKNEVTKNLKVPVPVGTRYIKITDKYNLNNIKRGLSVIVR